MDIFAIAAIMALFSAAALILTLIAIAVGKVDV
jgi:hypothetical protein